jgi:purine-nucleoside phosphorylase
MADLLSRVREATAFLKKKTKIRPEWLVVLGTGLGGLARAIRNPTAIPYDRIPHFVKSTGLGHKGNLIFGTLEGRAVMAMEGRFHAYEGYSLQEITLPIRVGRALGATRMVVSNACGGLNPLFRRGDLAIIEDHINLMGLNPLVGPNFDELGPRFPDMCEPYSRRLIERIGQVAMDRKIRVQRGVYAALTGPCLETRAEYRFLRTIGADMVGMSTVPEVIVAVHAGLEVAGFSIVTDMCLPDALVPAKIEEIIATAEAAEPRLTELVRGLIQTERSNTPV